MKKVPKLLGWIPVVLTLGCSSVVRQEPNVVGDGGHYRDLTLANVNPAPAKLSPPESVASNGPLLDDAYLSSQADFHFTMGETFGYEGQSPKAVEEYKLTLIYDPKSVHVRLRLAQEYVRMGMITEAVEQAEIAVEMAPQNIEAHMLLGGLYSGLKMFEQARNQFDQVLKIDESMTEAAIYLGALLAEERKYDEAIRYFETLTKNAKFKEPEKAYYYIGRVQAEQGQARYSDAEKSFNQALKLKPEYPEAALALAMLLKSQGRDREMERMLSSFQEKFGPEREMARQLAHYFLEKEDFDNALEQLEFMDGFERDNLNVKIQIALILIEQKKYESAAQRLEDVLMRAPESDKVRYYLGAVYEEIQKPQLAIQHYREIGPGSTYYTESVVHTAHLLKGLNRLDEAVETVEKALAKQEDVPQLYAYYATLLDEKKDYRGALKMLTRAVGLFPTNTQLRFFLGTMHDRVGDPQKTIAEMLKVLELDKEHVQALNYLAYTYAELNTNLEDAESLAGRALELQPNDGYILDTVGWVYFKKGENEKAIKYLEAAVKAKTDEAIIAEHLGDAYLRFQMWQKAQKMYQKAAELEADHNRNQKIMEKIANVNSQLQRPLRSPASVSH